MKKYKYRHYTTLRDRMFPHMFPHPNNSGETKKINQVLDKIWKWLSNPDDIDDVTYKKE